jgi:N-acetylneuraminate synthase
MGVYIIAEAGVNHNGNIEIAKKMIEMASLSGCDCIKFQTFTTSKLVIKEAPRAEYQIKNTKNEDSQFEMLKKLELKYEEFLELKNYCDKCNIEFLSTPFDEEAIKLLEKLNISRYKISSGDITNKYLLKNIAKSNKQVILSTGMSTLGEVEEAVQWIEEEGNHDIVLLHCTSNYPTPFDEVNMRAMSTLKQSFQYPVGYSDHTEGIEIPILAVALGACIIEKHFTLDKNMEGPDHKASLEPHELKQMVDQIRNVEKALGNGIKKPTQSELSTKDVARKSIVINKEKKAGEVIKLSDIVFKRPGTGILPKYTEEIVGKTLKNEKQKDSMLSLEDFV